MEENNKNQFPKVSDLEEELERLTYQRSFFKTLKGTVYTLITVAAVAVLIATFYLPVLQIYGGSMHPTLTDEDVVLSLKDSSIERGDIVAFYYNNKILVKRVIAVSGEWVNIEEDGTVLVNGEELKETYIEERSLGQVDIELPYQVPEGRIFVMGDHRSVSVDSRNEAVGNVAEEQIVGKLIYRIWPLQSFGTIE